VALKTLLSQARLGFSQEGARLLWLSDRKRAVFASQSTRAHWESLQFVNVFPGMLWAVLCAMADTRSVETM
jgi:hypothetical protein